ncbi:MAG: threonine/serine dehydratase [Pyrinomonadaceae bacterium]
MQPDAIHQSSLQEDNQLGNYLQQINLSGVISAAQNISPFVRRTPLIRSQVLSDRFGTNVYLKLEVLQSTGAFKVRGAFNRMLSLTEEQCGRGVVAVSGGNHAQAVAYAARELNTSAVILMPEFTPTNYLNATQAYRAQVILTKTLAQAFEYVTQYEDRGLTYIHPFDDPLVINGQGTIGLEIFEDLPQVTDVVLSIGGGGLAGGVGTSLKTLNPRVRIWGTETAGADSMARALAAGEIVRLTNVTSIAHTLGAPAVSETTLALAERCLEDVIVVTDEDALDSLITLVSDCKVLTEPAASCTLVALEQLQDQFSDDNHVVLVLCGGNFAIDDLFQCRMPVLGVDQWTKSAGVEAR